MKTRAKGPRNKLLAAGTAAVLAAALCAGVPGRGVAADSQPEMIVRADRIEAEDLLPSLATGSDGGLVLRLQIRQATAYGLTLTGNQPDTPAGIPWGLKMDSPGPVVLDQLVADATALGMEGIGMQLNRPISHVVLKNVFLRCDRLAASHVWIPSMKLNTAKGVVNAGPAPILDLRSLSVVNGQGLVDLINGLLAGNQVEDREKTTQGAESPSGRSGRTVEEKAGQSGTAPGRAESSAPPVLKPSRPDIQPVPPASTPEKTGTGSREISPPQPTGVTPQESQKELVVPVNDMPRELMQIIPRDTGISFGTGGAGARPEWSRQAPSLDVARFLEPLLEGGR